jgi:flagellar M-ring protein FliF
MADLNDMTKQAREFWTGRSKQQKMLLAAGAVASALLVAVFAGLLGSPDYKPLYAGLESADVQALSAQLDAQSIPHQTSADGKTISVPADKLDVARMQTASQGSPHSGRMGFELFDKMSWGQTEFDEKVTYQRALEGELERTIGTLSDVKSARVHLVMSTDSIYEEQQRSAKGSVILKLNRDNISKEAVQAIARLVAGAVDGLKPEDVSIVDADSDRSLNVSHDGPMSGEGLEASLTQRLMSTLEPIVGVGNIRASVNVDYDQASSEESQEKYDPSVSALLSDQKSQDQAGGGAAAGGIPGVASNVPSANRAQSAAVAAQPSATQMSTTENARYGVNRVVMHRVMPAGQVQRVSAAILVDDAMVKKVVGGKVTFARQARSQATLNQIQQLAQAVIGFDAKRGDTISVQDMSFATDEDAGSVAAPAFAERVQKTVSEYSALLRPLSLLMLFLLAYLFVLRPIQKQALRPALKAGVGVSPSAEQSALGGVASAERLALEEPALVDTSRRAAELKEQTIESIKQNPADTTRALQAWLREENL